MRVARLVGLSQDGRSLIVATETGEELNLAVDDRLRAALRGDRPRLGQLEIEMDTALSPREIQTRIRSGDSLEDVARVANLPLDRVERFAAPVLAEREHVASQALGASVRRRGETSGHRNLRTVLTERLTGRGVDPESLATDSYRLADGRWGVTASYKSGETERLAEFIFDPRGRYSVAANDDARWVLGEQSPSRGPQPGRRPPTVSPAASDGTEPTLDLNDELAIVRALQEPAPGPASEPEDEEPVDEEPVAFEIVTEVTEVEVVEVEGGIDVLAEIFADHNPEVDVETPPASDAVAVPVTAEAEDAWEPSIVVDYPVEPGSEDEFPVEAPPALADRFDERDELSEDIDEVETEATTEPPVEPEQPRLVETPDGTVADQPPAKTSRRKRASVPSWDEIMFGGPKQG